MVESLPVFRGSVRDSFIGVDVDVLPAVVVFDVVLVIIHLCLIRVRLVSIVGGDASIASYAA